MTPRQATKFEQICKLPRDGVCAPGFWIQLGDGTVSVAAQEWGEPASAMVIIPREVFDAFVDWYNHGTVPTKLEEDDEKARRVAGKVRRSQKVKSL